VDPASDPAGSSPQVSWTCCLSSSTSKCFPCRIGGFAHVGSAAGGILRDTSRESRKFPLEAQQIDLGRVHDLT